MFHHFYTESSRCISHISHVCLHDWFWPGGTGVPGCVATGLASTGVLGSEDKLSVNFFSSIPMGIRSGELNLPLMCSNSCTCIKEIWFKSLLFSSRLLYAFWGHELYTGGLGWQGSSLGLMWTFGGLIPWSRVPRQCPSTSPCYQKTSHVLSALRLEPRTLHFLAQKLWRLPKCSRVFVDI